jgi:hypothetical protein
MFEGQPADVFTTTSLTGVTTATEQTGLSTTLNTRSGLGKDVEEPVNREPIEIKTFTH